jgi:hypothetical protein
MRYLLISILFLCAWARPAAAQATGSVQVSLTILEPTQAQVAPQVRVQRTAGGQLEVQADVQLRGGATWSLSRGALRPAQLQDAGAEQDGACGAWSGSAAPAADDAPRSSRRVTARTRCDVRGRDGTARAPLVIVLAAN